MAKPPPPAAQEGAPEWMVSFADLVSIMMSFFVIMYALSPKKDAKNEAKMQKLMDSVVYRFGPEWKPFYFGGHPPKTLEKQRGKVGIPKRATSAALAPDEGEGEKTMITEVLVPGRGEERAMGGIVYFTPGAVDLTESETDRLKTIAQELAGRRHKIQILCHTTRRPLPEGSPYRDHFDLAYARGRVVADKLAGMGIDPRNLRVSVAGANEPLYPESDPATFNRNERVEIHFLDVLSDVEGAVPATGG